MKTKKIILSFILLALAAQTACSDHSKTKNKKVDHLIQKSRANMVYISSGTYTMGPSDLNWQAGNTTPHKVKLTGFYFSKYNTSWGEYDMYSAQIKEEYIQKKYKEQKLFFREANHPGDAVTWYQANNYCQWLREKTGLPYDLPTEAQWEYVARNLGKNGWFFATNNGKQELGKNFPSDEQYENQKGNDGDLFPLPIGSIPCTPMGICGLNGQINIWVRDWYDRKYYEHSPIADPQGPETGTLKTVRGGGAGGSPEFNHNFGRAGIDPNNDTAGTRRILHPVIKPDKLGAYAEGEQNTK